ncbi:PIG-L deacetylase family protein [Paenibacillus lautus]|uniref:PIG-L deacetylase family protein n=1 Tax=Paenibacillus lautus TaxID=1401 RepID=UPI003D28C2DC
MFVFIGAHYDDVIGSCAGRIALLRRNGEAVKAVTVFGGKYDKPLSPFAIELHQMWGLRNVVEERKIENATACEVLDVLPVDYDFQEAIYRTVAGRHLYPNDGDIFTNIVKEDEELIERIALHITNDYSLNDELYFPIGRGNHVDHLILKKCGEALSSRGYKIHYYDDFYYEGEVEMDPSYEKEKISFSLECMQEKVESFSKYSSQIPMLFGDLEKMSLYFQSINDYGGYYEVYYRRRKKH